MYLLEFAEDFVTLVLEFHANSLNKFIRAYLSNYFNTLVSWILKYLFTFCGLSHYLLHHHVHLCQQHSKVSHIQPRLWKLFFDPDGAGGRDGAENMNNISKNIFKNFVWYGK